MPSLGPYSRPKALAKLDGRRKEAKLVARIRADLVDHVGGQPSATQAMLIERAVQLALRIELIDRKLAESHDLTEHDTRTYLAWTASLSRLLRGLGLKAAPQRQASLADYLAARADPPGFKKEGGGVSLGAYHPTQAAE